MTKMSPLEQSIADQVRRENIELAILISKRAREAGKAADEARVAMTKLFCAFHNLATDLDKLAGK